LKNTQFYTTKAKFVQQRRQKKEKGETYQNLSEAFAAIFLRWCMAAHIATVTAELPRSVRTVVGANFREESRNSRVLGRDRALHKQALKVMTIGKKSA